MKKIEDIKRVLDENNMKFELTKELSRGGQGVVFRTTDKNIAIKLEFENSELGTISENLKFNEKYRKFRLLPINDVNITIPKSVLKNEVGYTMDILEDMQPLGKIFYIENVTAANKWVESLEKELSDYFSRYILTGGKRKRLKVFLEISKILSNLHLNGLVYCDLSPNNIFITSKGDNLNVWLIDADNIDYQEETRKGGYFTPGYGAPEVVNGKGCTFYSDSYSLAIILFEELIMNHPFKGSAEENEDWEDDWESDSLSFEEKKNAGLLPWILDSNDFSNKLNTTPLIEMLSEEIKKYFDKSFSKEGKDKIVKRTTTLEWVEIIAKELDKSAKCLNCELEYFENENHECFWCKNKNKILKINSYSSSKKNIWKFYQEVSSKPIKIPLRVVEGVNLKNLYESIFTISIEDNNLKIMNINYEYGYELYVNENKIIGIYEKSYDKKLDLRIVNKKNKKEVILEVELIC